MNENANLFHSASGITFPGVSAATLAEMRQELTEHYGLSYAQICEAASYSMAMVVRYALGLTASGGRVCALVRDTLSGWVALATLRHLVNAGAEAQVLILSESEYSAELRQQLHPLTRMGVIVPNPLSTSELDNFTKFLSDAHNVVCGVYDYKEQPNQIMRGIFELLNEERTPIHCVEAPPGVDVDNGTSSPSSLYASSTLSLGAPYQGLIPGKEFVGRHYLCDISIPRALYTKYGSDLTGFFSEQPVLQIYPPQEES